MRCNSPLAVKSSFLRFDDPFSNSSYESSAVHSFLEDYELRKCDQPWKNSTRTGCPKRWHLFLILYTLFQNDKLSYIESVSWSL